MQVIEGLNVGPSWDIDLIRSALRYKVRPDDIFLVTYTKSSTTWMEVIPYGLLNDAEAFDDNMATYFAQTSFLDLVDEQGMNNMQRLCVIKIHLPLDRISYHEKAKDICTILNPKYFVSYYHFVSSTRGSEYENAPSEVFSKAFVNGKIHFNSHVGHLRSLWKHKDDANVFITSYELMKHDIRSVIRQLAKFMDIELNDDLLKKIVFHASFGSMKEHCHEAYANQAAIALADESSNAPLPLDTCSLKTVGNYILVRKGVVGDWSSHLTDEQCQHLDQMFAHEKKNLEGLNEFFPKNRKLIFFSCNSN